MRTFVYTDDKSNKFWNIRLHGDRFAVTFGRVGTKGQTQEKQFDDAGEARQAHDKLVAEKLKKGYVETTPKAATPSAPVSPLLLSLERAIRDDPDDLASRAAHADHLAEQDDPRGEFIQVQLALEDPGRPANERARLRDRERELLRLHRDSWLGDVGRFLPDDVCGDDKPFGYQFRRGWLDSVRLLPFPLAVIASLAHTPEARMLRRLEVVYDMRFHPFDFDQFLERLNGAIRGDEEPASPDSFDDFTGQDLMTPLLASPHLSALRSVKLGYSEFPEKFGHTTMVGPFSAGTAAQAIELLGKCPHLEELYLNTAVPGVADLFAHPKLGQLRVLQYYYGSDYNNYSGNAPSAAYALSSLAGNAALRDLTTLKLHPGRDATVSLDELDALLRSPNLPALVHLQVHMTTYGDEGVRRIVDSGVLRRLETLDVGYGTMTDEGARLLAACPDAKNLKVLCVSRNALTERGLAALRAAGVPTVADEQHAEDDTDFLYEVDFE